MIVSLDAEKAVLLPDFFVAGAAKSGTTSLHFYLGQHPRVFMPALKESWFFSFMGAPPQFSSPNALTDAITRLEDYVRLYEKASEDQVIGDASPSYLFTHETSIRNMRAVYGDRFERLKIIILLRNPVQRAWSQYWTFKRVWQEPLEFEESIRPEVIAERKQANWNFFYDYIGLGMYHDQVKAYFDGFGRERVRVFLFEDLKQDAQGVCRAIFRFLDVDDSVRLSTTRVHNVSGKPRSDLLAKMILSPSVFKNIVKRLTSREQRKRILSFIGRLALKRVKLPDTTRRELAGIYEEEILRLQDLIGRDLSGWLK